MVIPGACWLFRVDDIGVFIIMGVIVAVGALVALADDWRTKRKEHTRAATPRRAA